MTRSSAATVSASHATPSASGCCSSGTSACPTSRRRPTPRTAASSSVLVGIDLGGTKIQAVALDGTEVVAKKKIPTPAAGGVELPAAIAGVIAELGVTVDRVGIGAPGVIDVASGTI